MSEPLEAETLARMKAEHKVKMQWTESPQNPWPDIIDESNAHLAYCAECGADWPCDVALLLAELERVTAPAELAKAWWNGFPALQFTSATTGLAYGLLGPSTSEELS